jgi:tRNA threonylcarbamoyladenosine biosynthesis protein TsaE
MKLEIRTASPEQTEAVGRSLAKTLKPGSILAMYGDLGAGKTTFVRGLAAGLGLTARVTSPTFTIVNEYEGATALLHFDMYRLKSSDELFDIGWEDYLASGAIIAVEWSENVPGAFDGTELKLRFEKLDEDTRLITIEGEPQ